MRQSLANEEIMLIIYYSIINGRMIFPSRGRTNDNIIMAMEGGQRESPDIPSSSDGGGKFDSLSFRDVCERRTRKKKWGDQLYSMTVDKIAYVTSQMRATIFHHLPQLENEFEFARKNTSYHALVIIVIFIETKYLSIQIFVSTW